MNTTAAENAESPSAVQDEISRRDLVQIGTIAAAGAAVAVAGYAMSKRVGPAGGADPIGEATVRDVPELASVPKGENADPLVRMQDELRRALAKPVEQRRWKMVIDTRKCVGCHACTVACIAENKLPPGVVYRPVLETEMGTFPNLAIRFMPRLCMQCETPACVPVCPVQATYKRPDGITGKQSSNL